MIAARALAALVFVAVFGYFLSGPVLNSQSGDGGSSGEPIGAQPAPADSPSLGRHMPSDNPVPRAVRIPFSCTSQHGGLTDVVAGFDGERVVITDPSGTRLGALNDGAPVGFSVGGILATGRDGHLWVSSSIDRYRPSPLERGEQQLTLGRNLRAWGWSPVADCAATIDARGRLQIVGYKGIPPGPSVTLAERGAATFTFAPDGSRLHFVVLESGARTLWTADLTSTGRIRPGIRFASDRCITCSPTGDFRVGIQDQRLALLDADGGFIRFLTEVETENGVWGESAPEWGPAGTGVLFERHMHLINQLWFIPERGSAPHFVASLEPLAALAGAFDWSATPPTGRPARSGGH